MSQDNTQNSDLHAQTEDLQTPATDSTPEETTESAAAEASELETLQKELAEANEQIAKLRDQALRAAAEAENVRKRAQKDVEAARKFALEKFASELLSVRDSLDMGLKAGEDAEADLTQLAEGMAMTQRMFSTAMEKFGIEEVNPVGEAFDPQFHEAVSMQETDAQEENTVVAVMQKGYTLNNRVLRAAMVIVAKAPSA